jgi:adenine-specific DNA-methyltransferase
LNGTIQTFIGHKTANEFCFANQAEQNLRLVVPKKLEGEGNRLKNETAVFLRVEPLASTWLHAEGFYQTAQGERKAYIHIGPQFGTVSRQIILGFSFESNISNATETTSMGSFEVTKVRMADDLLQEGLLKKDKKAASFMTIGEPDIKLHKNGDTVQVEIAGMDIYDPIRDEVKSFNREDIAYWMVDDDYDGASFIVKQVFFCGGDDEFDKWRKALEKTVKVEIDEEAWDRLYQHTSHPNAYKNGKKIAVRVISQFGEESTKVMELYASIPTTIYLKHKKINFTSLAGRQWFYPKHNFPE